ncbi:amine oxidase [Hyphomicrobium methylovorum]|uniref:phytoene desaturase family protein n=1 Tax=Hyphomicrobium methylovorum TaxID=84 RepID=UPI0015E66258|nr:FAD-dependent oxidoreductase [Hyphomicrobium methylovorum]MBA2125413.1 amine oxidase [Hyphomicrobium methylovorum]
MTRNVNIVGGGIAGLIAAIELARSGLRVTLFEKATELGGRARTREVQGFRFNQGPHALYCNGAFKRELDRLKVGYTGAASLSGGRKAILQGKLYELPDTMTSLLYTRLFGMRDKLAFVRLLKTIAKGATGPGTYAEWLDAQLLSPAVRKGAESLARLQSYANAPAIVSATKMLEQMKIGLGGTLYVDRGWSSLVAALADAAIGAGVRINRQSAAMHLVSTDEFSQLKLRDGSEHLADATILAIGPRDAASLAPGIVSLGREADEARSVRVNTLDLALQRWPLGAHEFAIGIDVPFYVSLHSGAASLAPDGGALVHLAKYLPINVGPGSNATQELESVADLVLPGWRIEEVARQQLRGMTVMHGLPRADRPRPDVVVTDAKGIFISGDWVGSEGMLADAAAASAIRAARMTIEFLSATEPARRKPALNTNASEAAR